ncbi:hypothetical protein [Bacillus kexueae]|uniref:hypothetical protein n=1 Tax=Aeribacillus kexueae TaxID=2078952 RepID=UPI001FAEDE5E|nr:hypothetical protein [Bacillus kexueae]
MKKGSNLLLIGIILFTIPLPRNYITIQQLYYDRMMQQNYHLQNVSHRETHLYIEDKGQFGIENIGFVSLYDPEQSLPTTSENIQLVDAQLKKVGERGIFEQTFSFYDQVIQLKDEFPLKKASDPLDIFPSTSSSTIEIKVNNQLIPSFAPVTFNPWDLSSGRYFGKLGLLLVEDYKSNTESLVVIQGTDEDILNLEKLNWQFVWISSDGQVKVESFNNTERKDFPYRTAFVNEANVTPTRLGYKTEGIMYYPTYFDPFVYPWLTTIISLILILIGLYRLFSKPKSSV